MADDRRCPSARPLSLASTPSASAADATRCALHACPPQRRCPLRPTARRPICSRRRHHVRSDCPPLGTACSLGCCYAADLRERSSARPRGAGEASSRSSRWTCVAPRFVFSALASGSAADGCRGCAVWAMRGTKGNAGGTGGPKRIEKDPARAIRRTLPDLLKRYRSSKIGHDRREVLSTCNA